MPRKMNLIYHRTLTFKQYWFYISAGNDILICGNCKSLHSSLATFVQHKKQKCELKKECKCHQLAAVTTPTTENNVIKEGKFPVFM